MKTASGNGVYRIRRNIDEPQGSIQSRRFRQRNQTIQSHVPIADCPGPGNDRFCQLAAQPLASIRRFHVEPLHFADFILKFPNRHATNGPVAVDGKEQSAIWWSISTGKSVKFLLESLKQRSTPRLSAYSTNRLRTARRSVSDWAGDDFHSVLSVQLTVHRHQLGRGTDWPLGAEADETSLLAANRRNVAVCPKFSGHFESELLQGHSATSLR